MSPQTIPPDYLDWLQVAAATDLFGASRPKLAQYLAELDTGLTEDESEEWLNVIRAAQGK